MTCAETPTHVVESGEAVIAGPQLIEVLLSVSVAIAERIDGALLTSEPDETVDLVKVDCVVDRVLVDGLERVDAVESDGPPSSDMLCVVIDAVIVGFESAADVL